MHQGLLVYFRVGPRRANGPEQPEDATGADEFKRHQRPSFPLGGSSRPFPLRFPYTPLSAVMPAGPDASTGVLPPHSPRAISPYPGHSRQFGFLDRKKIQRRMSGFLLGRIS